MCPVFELNYTQLDFGLVAQQNVRLLSTFYHFVEEVNEYKTHCCC